jgi:PAS domain-containing protein
LLTVIAEPLGGIIERNQGQESLQQSEGRLKTIMDAMHGVIVMIEAREALHDYVYPLMPIFSRR